MYAEVGLLLLFIFITRVEKLVTTQHLLKI